MWRYLHDLREERSEDAEGRVENLAELVSAAREFETREAEPSKTASSTSQMSGFCFETSVSRLWNAGRQCRKIAPCSPVSFISLAVTL